MERTLQGRLGHREAGALRRTRTPGSRGTTSYSDTGKKGRYVVRIGTRGVGLQWGLRFCLLLISTYTDFDQHAKTPASTPSHLCAFPCQMEPTNTVSKKRKRGARHGHVSEVVCRTHTSDVCVQYVDALGEQADKAFDVDTRGILLRHDVFKQSVQQLRSFLHVLVTIRCQLHARTHKQSQAKARRESASWPLQSCHCNRAC